MKKLCFVLLLMLAVSVNGFAQKGTKAIGLNLGYGSEIESFAIGAKFNYGVTDQIRVSPSFNYFLEKYGFSCWEINADVHYLFSVAPKVTVYPLAGLTFVGYKFVGYEFDLGDLFEGLEYLMEEDNTSSSSSTETKFGVNLGAGIGYDLTDNLILGLELKYSLVSDFDQFVPTINLTYKF
jgi:outer membrane protein X